MTATAKPTQPIPSQQPPCGPGHVPAASILACTMAVLGAQGCLGDWLTAQEAREAVEESSLAQQASALASASVEISTDFTIGQAVEDAADQVRAFVESQLPCAEVERAGGTLSITYGTRAGNCTYNGHRWSGVHSIEVVRNEMSEVLVRHRWDGLSNGTMRVDGRAEVTWDFDDRQRRIDHELTWTRLADGRMGVGRGQRAQSPLSGEGGLGEGIRIEGDRAWEGDSGRWSIDIDGVEVRWTDPVPQAGRYHLTTPFDKSLTLRFSRIDERRIQVTAEGSRRDFSFVVGRGGAITEAD